MEWLPRAQALMNEQQFGVALELVQPLSEAADADAATLMALAEIHAAAGSYVAARLAIAAFLTRAAADGAPVRDIPAVVSNDPDVRLRLLQLWLSHDGKNRQSLHRTIEHLRNFNWSVPPPAPSLSNEEFRSCYGARYEFFTAVHAPQSSQLSFWRDWIRDDDIQNFRSEVFLSQIAAHDATNFGAQALLDAYYLQFLYTQSRDSLGCLEKFKDDGSFGGIRIDIDGHILSRDILDSAMEINFFMRHAGIASADRFLLCDIGSGWGRLVNRVLELCPSAKAMALDVVPFASFAAERYLGHCGQLERAIVGGQSELDRLKPGDITIATNVHSWSEAPLASIEIWLDRLAALKVRYLFFVPHDKSAVSLETEGPGKPILPAIAASGYQIIAEEPKYRFSPGLRKGALYPFVQYYLFELRQ